MAAANRLADETSPYLLQHAANPVDWWPWCDEAFAEAARRDVPVLLSVGYSSCHWCHVMAHESFEDEETARAINEGFVAVKVDREERPDVDAIYMEAVQAVAGQGGWPMTVFLTHEGLPFYAGTYFPSRDTRGLPSFMTLLAAVRSAWQGRREEIMAQAERLASAVQSRSKLPGVEALPEGLVSRAVDESGVELLRSGVEAARSAFDQERGGFGDAPKFPQPYLLDFLAAVASSRGEIWSETERQEALEMLTTTLGAMAAGGLRDHLGGGFARYSTDPSWLVPHFEKMAYDQAALARVYLHAFQLTGSPSWREIAGETLEYLGVELSDANGGIHCAEDADSAGGEGLYYLWTREELDGVLGAAAGERAAAYWGVTSTGNFEGRNILHRPWPSELVLPSDLTDARSRLAEARLARERPSRDDKVLTEWSAMAASVMAEAAGVLHESSLAERAERIMQFLWSSLRTPEGRWLRSWRQGRTVGLALAADYAWVVEACTRLYEATGRGVWLERASETADGLLALFADPEGGFYTTGSDAAPLIVRAKEGFDGAVPSATSVSAIALDRLGELLGEERYRDAASTALESLRVLMAAAPTACGLGMLALYRRAAGGMEVVISGPRDDLLETVRARFLPTAVVAWGDRFPSPLWEGRDEPGAYVCRSYVCQMPARTTEDLVERLA